jgi:RNA polymerase sigma-70 factor, ECF subfamily
VNLTDTRSDEALMLAFRAGEAAAFDVLYQRHRTWLYNTLCRQLQDRSKADDVFQETWLSLVRSATRYEPKAKFSSWLYLLARQRLVDQWRQINPDIESSTFNTDAHEAEQPDLVAALADESADPMRQLERQQMIAQLESAISLLPTLQREALLLAEYADLSLEEIASATGTSRETVKSRLRYARGKLAQMLVGVNK